MLIINVCQYDVQQTVPKPIEKYVPSWKQKTVHDYTILKIFGYCCRRTVIYYLCFCFGCYAHSRFDLSRTTAVASRRERNYK